MECLVGKKKKCTEFTCEIFKSEYGHLSFLTLLDEAIKRNSEYFKLESQLGLKRLHDFTSCLFSRIVVLEITWGHLHRVKETRKRRNPLVRQYFLFERCGNKTSQVDLSESAMWESLCIAVVIPFTRALSIISVNASKRFALVWYIWSQ